MPHDLDPLLVDVMNHFHVRGTLPSSIISVMHDAALHAQLLIGTGKSREEAIVEAVRLYQSEVYAQHA